MNRAERRRKQDICEIFAAKRYCFGGSSQPTKTTTTNQTSYSPEEQMNRNLVMQYGRTLFDQSQGTFQPGTYPGSVPVAPSGDTTTAQANLRDFVNTQGAQTTSQAANALKFGFSDVLNPNSNPGLQSTLDTATRRITQAYQDPGGVLGAIRNNFTDAGGGASSREAIANGIAGRGYLDAIGSTTGQILSDAYDKGLSTFNSTMYAAPNLYNLMTQPEVTRAAIGQNVESASQAQNDYNAAARMYAINGPQAALQNYANIVLGTSTPTSTVSGVIPPVKGNPYTNAAGGAMVGYQMGGGWGAAAGAIIGLLATN